MSTSTFRCCSQSLALTINNRRGPLSGIKNPRASRVIRCSKSFRTLAGKSCRRVDRQANHPAPPHHFDLSDTAYRLNQLLYDLGARSKATGC